MSHYFSNVTRVRRTHRQDEAGRARRGRARSSGWARTPGHLGWRAAASEVEGNGRTLTPGLIDCHVHCRSTGRPTSRAKRRGSRRRSPRSRRRATPSGTLAHGVTTVRDLGRRGLGDLRGGPSGRRGRRPRTAHPGGRPGAHGHRWPRSQPVARARGRWRRQRPPGGPRGDQGRRARHQGDGDGRRAHPRDRRDVHRVHPGGAGGGGRRGPQVGARRRRARDRRRGRLERGRRRRGFGRALRPGGHGARATR